MSWIEAKNIFLMKNSTFFLNFDFGWLRVCPYILVPMKDPLIALSAPLCVPDTSNRCLVSGIECLPGIKQGHIRCQTHSPSFPPGHVCSGWFTLGHVKRFSLAWCYTVQGYLLQGGWGGGQYFIASAPWNGPIFWPTPYSMGIWLLFCCENNLKIIFLNLLFLILSLLQPLLSNLHIAKCEGLSLIKQSWYVERQKELWILEEKKPPKIFVCKDRVNFLPKWQRPVLLKPAWA